MLWKILFDEFGCYDIDFGGVSDIEKLLKIF